MHLGERRISDELMGFDLPVRDGAAQKEFYTDLGFEAEEANGNVRLTSPGAPDVHIELRPAHPGSQPQFLFPVPDARKAADELKDAGVKADTEQQAASSSTIPRAMFLCFLRRANQKANNRLQVADPLLLKRTTCTPPSRAFVLPPGVGNRKSQFATRIYAVRDSTNSPGRDRLRSDQLRAAWDAAALSCASNCASAFSGQRWCASR